MAYANPFLRLVFGGMLYDVEEWSCSLSIIEAEPGGAHPDYPETVPAGVISAVEALIVSARTDPAVSLAWIKLNPIGTDGKYMSNQTVRYDDTTPGVGSGSSGHLPQSALVVSLATGFARGRAHAGRFYLPIPSTQPAVDGLVSTGNIAPFVTAATTFLDALNTTLTGFRVGVTSNLDAGAEREVTYARVGRVIDTMRSRRNKLGEAYATGAALAGG